MTRPPPSGPSGPLQLWLSSDEPDGAAICLRFSDAPAGTAPLLEPARVTALLDLTPSQVATRGQRLPPPRQDRVAEQGFWRWNGPTLAEPALAVQLTELLARLPPAGSVWEELRPYCGELICAVYLDFWNRECNVPATLVEAIAARHLALHFDIYFPGSEPESDETDDEAPSSHEPPSS